MKFQSNIYYIKCKSHINLTIVNLGLVSYYFLKVLTRLQSCIGIPIGHYNFVLDLTTTSYKKSLTLKKHIEGTDSACTVKTSFAIIDKHATKL